MPSRRSFLASVVSFITLWPFTDLAIAATPAEELQADLLHLRNAPRIAGLRQSYRWDSPQEYTLVMNYLNGGSRPNPSTDIGIGLVLIEDARRELAGG